MSAGHQVRPTASVYVDGFNLYRRALDDRPERRWLDLVHLSDLVLPDFQVVQVRYFTSLTKFVEGADPRGPSRQQAYLRALGTLERLSIHFGSFRSDRRWMARSPLVLDDAGAPELVRVRKIEEKGTDVSLAAHLVCDAMQRRSDAVFLLSNDSDFVEALRLARGRAGVQIGLLSPSSGPPAGALLALQPDHVRHVRGAALDAAQLPSAVLDGARWVLRPDHWRSRA